jgi:Bacterial Ig-like domain (group 3)
MSLTIRRLAGGVAMTLLTVAGAATSAHASAAPPWEPDGSSQGGLTFYNAAGHAITGGTLSSAPIAAYVVGGASLRSGDTKATLFGYLPVKGKSPSAWSGEELSTSTTFPSTGAPAGVSSTLPVVTGGATDTSLGTLSSDFPNKGTGSYAGIYQLRLVTSAAGTSATSTYDSADVQISGNSWSVVYSGGVVSGGGGGGSPAATHTTLKGSKASIKHGAKLTLTASETPKVAGKVAFFNGSKKLGTVVVKKGKATYATKTLKVGTHKLHAAFTPSNTTKDKPSTSKVVSVKVTKS